MILQNLFVLFQLYFLKSCYCVKNYENYSLFRAIPVNEEQVKYLENLPNVYDVQIWKPSEIILRAVDFTISPEDKKSFLKEANQRQLYLTTIHPNVQNLFNKQTVRSYIRRDMGTFDWYNYYRAKDIYAWLRDLASLHPKNMRVFGIGMTVEKRKILAVKISLNDQRQTKRSTVIVEGGIHAREWISPAFVTYLINRIIHAPSDSDHEFRNIAYRYDWVIVPLLNPDGYEFTHTQDRLWRKNRNNYGVDLNRNFDVAFGTVGISRKQTSDTYCGEKAFSEQESKAMAELVDKYKDKLEFYIAFHSYGQFGILPFAHLKNHVGNFDEVKKMGDEMAKQIKRRYGSFYTIGTAYDTVGYMTSGVSGCWVKQTYNTPYVLTMELRDQGSEGFALSPKYILPTCQETIDGLVSFLNPAKLAEYKKLHTNNSESYCLKNVILLLNFVAFIILCFDYLCIILFVKSFIYYHTLMFQSYFLSFLAHINPLLGIGVLALLVS